MAYVWGPSVQVTVQQPLPALSIKSVWVEVPKTTVNVNEDLTFNVWTELNRPVQSGESGSIEFVYAIDSTANIVRRGTVSFAVGQGRYKYTFTHRFDRPGTYRIYGGARLVLPTTPTPTPTPGLVRYTPIMWGSRDIVVGYPEPSPDLTNLLVFITGAIIGIEAYKKWQEVKGRLPRISIARR